MLGLFALENITMAEMFGCKTALPGWPFLKKLVVLSLPVWSYPGGYFLHHDGILVSDRHMIMAYSVIGLISALKMPEVKTVI